jgi:hypothetical protein
VVEGQGDRDVRASDAEREAAVARLRAEALAGRITVEELEERLPEVMRARTTAELTASFRDLPAELRAVPSLVGRLPARRQREPPGVLPFTHTLVATGEPERVHATVLSRLSALFNREGFDLTSESATSFVFEDRSHPPWTFAVAILLFPLGLIAFLLDHTERITVVLEHGEDGTTLVHIHGNARRGVRKRLMRYGGSG